MARTITIPAHIGTSQKLSIYINGTPYEFMVGEEYTVADDVADAIEQAVTAYNASHAQPERPDMLSGGAKALAMRLDDALKRISQLEDKQGGELEMLNRIVVPLGGLADIELVSDAFNRDYALKGVFCKFSISSAASAATTNLKLYFHGSTTNTLNYNFTQGINTGIRHYCALANRENGFWRMKVMPPQATESIAASLNSDLTTMLFKRKVSTLPSIRMIKFSVVSGVIPANSIMEVWGHY